MQKRIVESGTAVNARWGPLLVQPDAREIPEEETAARVLGNKHLRQPVSLDNSPGFSPDGGSASSPEFRRRMAVLEASPASPDVQKPLQLRSGTKEQ